MAVLCDTATVPVGDRADLWTSMASDMFVPLECTPHDRATFNGRLRAGVVGPLALCGLEVSPHTIKRTPKLAANTPGDQYKLSLMLGGEALIVQDRRDAVLRPGDFAIYDCSRPYTIVGGDQFRMLICMLPRDVIGLSPERMARVTATRIAGRDGLGWAMAPFLKRLADLAVRDEVGSDHHRVVESVVDLVESLCAGLVDDVIAPGASRAALMLRIRAYVEAHLDEPDLSPTQVAAAHFVSKRYLHKLFEAEGVSVSRWIRERRLEHCRRDLADPDRRDHTVTSIGVRWGLVDSAHFSRLFRETYGCSPTEYRHEHLPRLLR
jgi:AraC-like DNA-binding protein